MSFLFLGLGLTRTFKASNILYAGGIRVSKPPLTARLSQGAFERRQLSKVKVIILPVRSYPIARYVEPRKGIRMQSAKVTMNNRAIHKRTKWMNWYARHLGE